ncbi:MAG TPA: Holliday junction resolvase RuvX [Clostridiales bacterium]|nr:Holliday junction resolvase RuvX [Clostridiales bacterium]HPP68335.1 Holliday junction resolvase RuvX [Clostridiales bacterium]
MVILAVDYGEARTGLAVCDKNEVLATPLSPVVVKSTDMLIDTIIETAKQYKAELIVVGLPVNMDGSHGFRAEVVKEFAQLLKEKSGMPVEFWDERLTTMSASRLLNETDVKGKKRKMKLDSAAAALILQSFIDSRKRG